MSNNRVNKLLEEAKDALKELPKDFKPKEKKVRIVPALRLYRVDKKHPEEPIEEKREKRPDTPRPWKS